MQFSLFFFSAACHAESGDLFDLFRQSIRYADRHGWTAVWTPERHFSPFGGMYASPSITAAVAAALTDRLGVRAGSVVLPLREPIRVAEEWAMIDQLSRGRAGVSFASGWHANDFVLSPRDYGQRRDVLYERLDVVQKLWRGESLRLPNGAGEEVDVRLYPPPYQSDIPIWITAQSEATCIRAGSRRAHLLTNMNYHHFDELSRKIQSYRQALDGTRGHVTLMVHAFVADDATIDSHGKPAYADYLMANLDLQAELARGLGLSVEATEEDKQFIISRAVDRMIHHVGLIGPPDFCLQRVQQYQEMGVDEIACLVDFGVSLPCVMSSLDKLSWVKQRVSA